MRGWAMQLGRPGRHSRRYPTGGTERSRRPREPVNEAGRSYCSRFAGAQ